VLIHWVGMNIFQQPKTLTFALFILCMVVCIHTCVCVCVCLCIHTCVCVFIRVSVYSYVCLCIHTCMCVLLIGGEFAQVKQRMRSKIRNLTDHSGV